MSIERPSKNVIVFQCDNCYDTVELTRDDVDVTRFSDCWEAMREKGWRIINSEHLCEDCRAAAKPKPRPITLAR